jgi:hypothetical protein
VIEPCANQTVMLDRAYGFPDMTAPDTETGCQREFGQSLTRLQLAGNQHLLDRAPNRFDAALA